MLKEERELRNRIKGWVATNGYGYRKHRNELQSTLKYVVALRRAIYEDAAKVAESEKFSGMDSVSQGFGEAIAAAIRERGKK